jgi:hypothetical protein
VVKTYKEGMVSVFRGEFECTRCKDIAPWKVQDILQGFSELSAEYLVKQAMNLLGIPPKLLGKQDRRTAGQIQNGYGTPVLAKAYKYWRIINLFEKFNFRWKR